MDRGRGEVLSGVGGQPYDDCPPVDDDDRSPPCLQVCSAFYAPSPMISVAVHQQRIAAGSVAGELYYLELV